MRQPEGCWADGKMGEVAFFLSYSGLCDLFYIPDSLCIFAYAVLVDLDPPVVLSP